MNQYKSKKLLGSTPNYNAKNICLDTVSYYKEDESLIDKLYQDFAYDRYLGGGIVKSFFQSFGLFSKNAVSYKNLFNTTCDEVYTLDQWNADILNNYSGELIIIANGHSTGASSNIFSESCTKFDIFVWCHKSKELDLRTVVTDLNSWKLSDNENDFLLLNLSCEGRETLKNANVSGVEETMLWYHKTDTVDYLNYKMVTTPHAFYNTHMSLVKCSSLSDCQKSLSNSTSFLNLKDNESLNELNFFTAVVKTIYTYYHTIYTNYFLENKLDKSYVDDYEYHASSELDIGYAKADESMDSIVYTE